MGKKPANLLYGVDENPPLWTTLLLGLQHVFIISVYFIFPVIIIKHIEGSAEQAEIMIKMSMIAIGLTTILQAFHKGPIGSGYLAPSGNGPAYLSASLLAANTGGLSLVCGMTIITGIFEALFSRLIARLRSLFPPEVAGLVVTLVGIELVPLGIKRFLGTDYPNIVLEHKALIVALITFAAMVGFTTWGKGKLRLYPILIGMGIGYLLSYLLGILTPSDLKQINQAPWLDFPKFASFGWSFDLALLLPFMIATICSSLKDVGDITTCQKINDSEWKRSDMRSISRGILADSLGDIISGVLGGLGQTTSSSNIGLSIATGATSRYIAYTTGAILCFLAFFPKLAEIFVIMPEPVMGAILVFVATFMIIAGIQIITTRMLDTRKIFVVGTALIFGLSVEMVPGAYAHIPPLLQPIFSSTLSLGTICVIILNLIFRLGIAKKVFLELIPGVDSSEKIFDFMENHGAAWGARPGIIHRAASVINEFLETAANLDLAIGPLHTIINFDEFNLDVVIIYKGKLLEITGTKPSPEELLSDAQALGRLSGFLMKTHADKVKSALEEGQCRITFHFDH